MRLNLTKPIVIFDLETTGIDLVKDRIIQISYIKVYPDGKEERGNELVNPEKPIDSAITQLTGITNEDVKDKPTFKQRGQKAILQDLIPTISIFPYWQRNSCVLVLTLISPRVV